MLHIITYEYIFSMLICGVGLSAADKLAEIAAESIDMTNKTVNNFNAV